MAGFGVGASLASMGVSQKDEAMRTLGAAADQEARRNEENEARKAQARAGKQQLGATLGSVGGWAIGAQYGSSMGPYGALIGGAIGALAGNLFSLLLVFSLVLCCMLPTTAEARNMVNQMEVHQILDYDPTTGVFTWVDPAAQCVHAGDRAGFERKTGYRYIKIGGRAYAEHRLAWLYMIGEWPQFEIDHKNRLKTDNRFANLRAATRKQNCENRAARKGAKSQFRGVSWSGGKWVATIMHFGKQKSLGAFDDIEKAKAARLKAEGEMFTHSTRV